MDDEDEGAGVVEQRQDAPPTMEEIVCLLRSQLDGDGHDDGGEDEIALCGRPALAILEQDPDMCMRMAYQKLHDVPYKDVGSCWRRLYTDAALRKVLVKLERCAREGHADGERYEDSVDVDVDEGEDWLTDVVESLDMALILTGAPRREAVIELIFSALEIGRAHV